MRRAPGAARAAGRNRDRFFLDLGLGDSFRIIEVEIASRDFVYRFVRAEPEVLRDRRCHGVVVQPEVQLLRDS